MAKENPNSDLLKLYRQAAMDQEMIFSDNQKDPLDAALESPYEKGSREDHIFNLCKESHATIDELSTVLDIPKGLLENDLLDVIERGYTACRILLRRQQLRSAKDGDGKLQQWLGKQILGQQDKMQLDIPMTIVVDTGIRRTPPITHIPAEVVPCIPVKKEDE